MDASGIKCGIVAKGTKVPEFQGVKVLGFKVAKGNKEAQVKRSTQGQGVCKNSSQNELDS